MLYTVKQIKNLIIASITSNFNEINESSPTKSDNKDINEKINSDEMSEDFIENNSELIIEWLKSKDITKEDGILSLKELMNWEIDNGKAKIESLLKILKMNYKFENWVSIQNIIEKINKFLNEKEKIIDKTKENFWKIEWTFWGIQEVIEQRKNVNMVSFEQIVSKLDPSQLSSFIKEINKITDKNNKDWNFNYFNPFNIWEIKDFFEKNWYKPDGFFGWEEVASLITLFENIELTQRKIPSLNWSEKIKILLDYNIDWIIDNDIHYYTKERKFLEAIKNESRFENLLINLWYTSNNDFNTRFSNNYYEARKEFKEKLATIFDNDLDIDPIDMLKSRNAVKDAVIKENEIRKNEKFIRDTINNNPILKEAEKKDKKLVEKIKTELTKTMIGLVRKLADKIKFVWAWIMAGSVNWLAVSFDIKEATNKIIDSIQFWVVNWTFWFVLNKNVIDLGDWKLKLDLWLLNFIPYIYATWEIYETKLKEFKDLFPKEIEKWAKVTLGWWISIFWVWWVWLDISKIDETTKNWIEKATLEMSKTLDKIFKFIVDGNNFEKTWLNNTKENKNAYKNLNELYKSFWEAWVSFLKEWALNNYKNELYRNAKWFKFTWASIWIANAFWFLIPIIWVHWENTSTKWVLKKKERKENWIQISINPTPAPTPAPTTETVPAPTTETVPVPAPIIENEKIEKTKDEYFKWIENNNVDLKSALDELDSTITFRTRTNKYANEIMDPNNNLNVRWKWFKDFANRRISKKMSKELSDTIKAFKNVLNKINENNITDNEKKYIISTVIQLMKKANDTYSWAINSEQNKKWNYKDNYEDIIEMKLWRRNKYNNIFWFDVTEESDAYNKKLQTAWKNWTIWEVTISSISFDASSSLINSGKTKKSIKNWIDVFYSNIQILSDWKNPILVPITDKQKINAFIEKINSLNSIDENTKKELIKWITTGKIELNYYSDPDWFDDRIIPIVKWIPKKVEVVEKIVKVEKVEKPKVEVKKEIVEKEEKVGVYEPENTTSNWGIFWTWGEKKPNETKEKPKAWSEAIDPNKLPPATTIPANTKLLEF